MKEKSFMETLKVVMEHNAYKPEMLTVEECSKKDKWTPCDLVIREYLNNGCGSAKGFLGIGSQRCENTYHYICEHKAELVKKGWINKDGWNNWGFPLWKDYNFCR